ncbi:MAG: uracil-DNA glycosylase [Burkholderiaceae bacterium]|nr:uracil-DNA glycosylase [Burkholderiaceae bacterium]
MRWSARQRAMLDAMGLRLWEPPAPFVSDDERAETQPAGSVAAEDAGATGRTAASTARATPAGEMHPARRPAHPVAPSPTSSEDGPPRTPDVSKMDWPTLRETVSSCRACALCESRTQTVFGCGNAQADWMIVGEAPGEKEDLLGEPFVGKAGQLLDAMLRAIELTRQPAPPAQQVYIANTLKCRPPANRNPMPIELTRCEPYLVRQVELVRPRIILAMGRFAVQALLRSSEPIGRLRGRVHRYLDVPLVVTYHPAYLLRNPPDKARAWDDLCLAKRVVKAHRVERE